MSETRPLGDNDQIPRNTPSGRIDPQTLHAVFLSSPNAISISDLNGDLQFVNPHALELFGHPDDSDVIGQSVFAWIAPEDQDHARAMLQRLIAEGAPVKTQVRLRRRDGSTFTGEIRATVVRTHGPVPTHLIFSAEDRTAEIQYEHALQAILKGTSPNVGGQFFPSFIRELTRALGMRFAFIGRAIEGDPGRIRTIAHCVDGELREPVTFALAGTPCAAEDESGLAFFTQDAARTFPSATLLQEWKAEAFVCVSLRASGGQFKGVLAVGHDRVVHDTTLARSIMAIFAARAAAEIGRLEADESLWENERRIRSIIDQAPFGAHLYELMEDGRLIFAGHNRSADRILKVDHHHLVGMTIEEAWPPLAATPIPEAYKRVARGEGPYGENAIQYESGGVDGAFEINAFQTSQNRMAVFFRDVTERKKAEIALLAAKEKAEHADRAKTALLSNLSHEFRTPITGILGMADILRARAKDHGEREAIDGIVISAQRLHHSLDAILKLSQLVSGTVRPVPHEVRLLTSVQRAMAPFRKAADAKGLTLEAHGASDGELLVCDGQMLEDILGHLIDNAIKYTNQGGITIRSSSLTLDGKAWCAIDIEDTGIGIAPEDHETIFQEFRQLSEGFGREYEGSGLGLTVARRMAELMGGTIVVRSQRGAGSTFSLRLPVAIAAATREHTAPAPPLPRESAAPRPAMPQVLIVEDNFINKTVIAEFLKHMCKTDHARDGKTAIRMAQEKHYDAVLMDINLGPGLDGIETTKVIRQIAGYKETPIVAVTGYTLPGDRDRLLAEGLTSYIPKPFAQRDLQETVRAILPR